MAGEAKKSRPAGKPSGGSYGGSDKSGSSGNKKGGGGKPRTKESTKRQSMLNTHKINPFKYDMNEVLSASSMDPAKSSAFLASVIAKASRVSTKDAKEFVKTYLDSGDITKDEYDKMVRLLDRYSKFRRGPMRFSELTEGRTFVLRLEEGEVLHEAVESFCRDKGILRATVSAIGGVDAGSEFVSGPDFPVGERIEPLTFKIDAPCELAGTGTIFPDLDGNPVMHMHGSVGRRGVSHTGCFRKKMMVWLTMEVVVHERVGEGPVRMRSDPRIDALLMEVRRWLRRRF